MDHTDLREGDFELDLESGGTTSEEDGSKNHVSSIGQGNKFLDNGIVSFDGSDKGKKTAEEKMGILEKKSAKEKHKKTNSKKPPKPPRPPRGPLLDAADRKLVREITELAMLKRARVERMNRLKKKSVKATSSSSSLCAMFVTVLFCLVILFQGFLGSRV